MQPDGPLDATGLDRLRMARGGVVVDPTRSLFDPAGVVWRVTRETAILLGGGRALLLQVAHPLVAAGVAAHSDFRRRPLDRLWRTLDLMLTLVFSDATAALRAVQEIERRHAWVRGVLDVALGPFPRGTPYDANDPTLLLWVYATLLDTALLVYERFVGPLTAAEKSAYYDESKVAMRLFGIPDTLLPPTFDAFTAYMREMLGGDTLVVGPAGREVADSILRPPLFPGLREAVRAGHVVTIGLLPPGLRVGYGLSWNGVGETLLAGLAAATRVGLRVAPALVREMPHARAARRAGRCAAGPQ